MKEYNIVLNEKEVEYIIGNLIFWCTLPPEKDRGQIIIAKMKSLLKEETTNES